MKLDKLIRYKHYVTKSHLSFYDKNYSRITKSSSGGFFHSNKQIGVVRTMFFTILSVSPSCFFFQKVVSISWKDTTALHIVNFLARITV